MHDEDVPRLTREYLLGGLGRADQDEYEARLFDDPSLADRIEDTERDLLDDYARNQLKGTERSAVESRILVLPGRRERLQLAYAMHARTRRTVRVWPFAVAATILLALGLWYVRPGPLATKPSLAREPAARTPAPQFASPRQPVRVPVVASFLLQPGTLRGGDVPLLEILGDVTRLRLELELAAGATTNLNATITGRGKTVWKQDGLTPYTVSGSGAVAVELPAGQFSSGSYEAELKNSAVQYFYYFRVVRKE